jgi:4-hydroxybenzoate polyprenyltransferase
MSDAGRAMERTPGGELRIRVECRAGVGWNSPTLPRFPNKPVLRALAWAGELAALLQTLCFYVAAGIASFGWAICHLLGWRAAPYLPLWFCSALLIYNADRLRRDPVDTLNIPQRAAASVRLRKLSLLVLVAAALVLVGLPIARGDWLTLSLIAIGAPVCLGYSAPIFGFRFKDVPLLKTLFAPTIVSMAVVGLPWFHEGAPPVGANLALTVFRAWCFLLFDMILCDLRDLEGDRRMGIRSLPVSLGEKHTRSLLWALLAIIEISSLTGAVWAPARLVAAWRLASVAGPFYLGWLMIASRARRSEAFYEWGVEGMLFLPAVVCAVGMLF